MGLFCEGLIFKWFGRMKKGFSCWCINWCLLYCVVDSQCCIIYEVKRVMIVVVLEINREVIGF